MKSCPIFPVVGAITAVGPNNLDKGGVLYRYIDICEKGGRTRRLTIVRAVEALAALIELYTIGIVSRSGKPGAAVDRQCMGTPARRRPAI